MKCRTERKTNTPWRSGEGIKLKFAEKGITNENAKIRLVMVLLLKSSSAINVLDLYDEKECFNDREHDKGEEYRKVYFFKQG